MIIKNLVLANNKFYWLLPSKYFNIQFGYLFSTSSILKINSDNTSSDQKDSSSGGALFSVPGTESFSQSNESIKTITRYALSDIFGKIMLDLGESENELKKIEVQQKIANKLDLYWAEHRSRSYNECLDALKAIHKEMTGEMSLPDYANREISQSSTVSNKDTGHTVQSVIDLFIRTTALKKQSVEGNIRRDPEEVQKMYGLSYPVIKEALDRLDREQAASDQELNSISERIRDMLEQQQRGRQPVREEGGSEPNSRPRSRSSLLEWFINREGEASRPASTGDIHRVTSPTRFVAELEQESPPSYIDDVD